MNKITAKKDEAQHPYAVILREEHLPLVAELERACFYSPWSADALRLLIGENALGAVIIENGRALAYAGMTAVLDEGAITNVATHPDARRRGLGEAVLSFLLAKGMEKGLTTFSLEVRETNAPAIRLYEKLGFVALGRRRNFYRHPSEDALIMVKQITES